MNKKDKILIENLPNVQDGETSYYHIPKQLASRNIAYQGMQQDLTFCKQALIKLKKTNDETVMTALFTSVIVLYGKCFTDSSSSKYPKLELNIFESQNPEFLLYHNEIMNMRHNFISHRGLSEQDYGKAFMQIKHKTMEWGVYVRQLKRYSFEVNDILNYLNLVDFVNNIVEEKYLKTSDKVLKNIFDNFSDDEIKNLKILNK